MRYAILEPDRQISFYHRLQDLKRLYLHEAMVDTIAKIDIAKLDKQLAKYVNQDALKQVASFGLRGEIFFPVPYIIKTNPYLLGYYRLLFGISGKNFYDQGPFKTFRRLESSGNMPNDPDISITSILDTGVRPLVSIEIKGGTDKSNAYNRLGEAEKSHQSAKARGFFEFWTVVRVDVDSKKSKEKSPTTTHFFHIDRISDLSSDEHALFKNLLGSIIGIKV